MMKTGRDKHFIKYKRRNYQIWSVIPSKEYLFLASSEGIGKIKKNDEYEQIISKKDLGSVYVIEKSKILNNILISGSRQGLALIDINSKNKFKKIDLGEKGAVWKLIENQKKMKSKINKKGFLKIKFSNLKGLDSNYLHLIQVYNARWIAKSKSSKIHSINN